MTGLLVSLTAVAKGRVLAAMKPGSQTAQPLHSEPVAPPRHAREPWLDSPGVARRRARRAAEEKAGGRS